MLVVQALYRAREHETPHGRSQAELSARLIRHLGPLNLTVERLRCVLKKKFPCHEFDFYSRPNATMETIIPSFMRVQRGQVTASKVTSLYEHIASNGNTNLTHADRLAVVDLPDPDDVASNIGSVTALSKSALQARVVESPELLTMAELRLLMNRYWLDMTGPERKVMSDASDQLTRISPDHRGATMEELRRLRLPFYDDTQTKIKLSQVPAWN